MKCLFSRVFALVLISVLSLTTVATAQIKGYFREAGNDSLDVSLVQLIANPEKYDGKRVRFIGFLRLEFEGNGIFLHQEDERRGIGRNGLWVNVPDDMTKKQAEEINGQYVICVGTFRAGQHGHMGMYSGEISNVRRLQLWGDRVSSGRDADSDRTQ